MNLALVDRDGAINIAMGHWFDTKREIFFTWLIQGIDIGPLLKAQATFERFRQHLSSDQEKAGAVQAFEFSYELAWKTMKRFLLIRGC